MGRPKLKTKAAKKVTKPKRHRRTKAEMQAASEATKPTQLPLDIEMVDLPDGLKIPKSFMQAWLLVEKNLVDRYNELAIKHNDLLHSSGERFKVLEEGLQKLLDFASVPVSPKEVQPNPPVTTTNGVSSFSESSDPLDII